MINGIERVGVYGGTFAPIHNGHVVAAKAFLEQMKLDRLLIIPTYIPPHKSIEASDDPKFRLEMCRIAFDGVPSVTVSDMEIRRAGVSYTYDTLRELTAPGRKLFLLCGTDMMLTFDRWYRFEDIFKMCCPVYVRREYDESLNDKIVEKNKEFYQKYNIAFRRIVADPIDISSTEIRDMIKNHEDTGKLLPPAVYDYIRKMKLYE